MIEIKKFREPRKLESYRQKPDASYAGMKSDLKKEILDSLLQEQGHICAYCMRRIPESRQLPQGVLPATIEHWYPQNPESKEDIGQGLDYRNMYAVCAGNRGCGNKDDLTCDAKRGNRKLTVNPCKASTLTGIGYSANGRIFSLDPEVDRDLNEKLNLNCEKLSLPQNRQAALNVLLSEIRKKHPTGDIKPFCRKRLAELKEHKEKKIPYVGILISWLEKHT